MNDAIYDHQFIFIPWTSAISHSAASIEATERIATKRGLAITVAVQTLQYVPDVLSRAAKVTERSGHVKPGGVVLAYYPTYRLMSKIDHLWRSVVVLAEWHQDDHSGWAKSVGAYNVTSGVVMSDGLNEEGNAAIEALLFAGYKGWHDSMAIAQANRALNELLASGGYDRQVVLFRARKARGERGIEKIHSILDNFERDHQIAADRER